MFENNSEHISFLKGNFPRLTVVLQLISLKMKELKIKVKMLTTTRLRRNPRGNSTIFMKQPGWLNQ